MAKAKKDDFSSPEQKTMAIDTVRMLADKMPEFLFKCVELIGWMGFKPEDINKKSREELMTMGLTIKLLLQPEHSDTNHNEDEEN